MAFGKEEVCAYLDSRGVVYDRVDHEAVFTMEAMDALALPFANAVVKNLFLRDDKKRNYYLVVMPEDKPANLKALRTALGARPLRFASEEDLQGILGLRGGAVSPFGVLNDEEGKVQVVFDEVLRDWWACIPTTTRPRCAFLCPTCWRCSKIAPCSIGSWIWMWLPRSKDLLFRHLIKVA